jgi:hypothetical protein
MTSAEVYNIAVSVGWVETQHCSFHFQELVAFDIADDCGEKTKSSRHRRQTRIPPLPRICWDSSQPTSLVFVAFPDIRNRLRRPRQGEFMEREATSGYHRHIRLPPRSVQIPSGKCRLTLSLATGHVNRLRIGFLFLGVLNGGRGMQITKSFMSLLAMLCAVGIVAPSLAGECQKHFKAKQFDKAAVSCLQEAKAGNAIAQNNLGEMYYSGEGVSKDLKMAAHWLRMAAEQGNARSQFILRLMYHIGKGFSRNDELKIKWYRKAANQGDILAQHNLGGAYASGEGVP